MHRNCRKLTKAIAIGLGFLLLLGACTQNSGNSANSKSKKPKPEHLVEAIAVNTGILSHASVNTGTLRARRLIRIFNQEEGRLTNVPFYEGDIVREGAVLINLDDKLLKAEYGKAMATGRQAEQDLRRLQGMVSKELASKDELIRANTALEVAQAEETVLRTRLGYMDIKAPFSGVVSERLVEPGDVVAKNTHLLTVYDPESLITEITVSELLLPYLKVGDKTKVRIDALGDETYTGIISRIHPVVDDRTRQGLIEVEFHPVPKGASVGQFCRVYLDTRAENRIAIPFTALQRDREGEFVFVLDNESKAHRNEVRSGLRLADKVEILEGLEVGQKVIVKGFLGLSDGKHENRRTVKIRGLGGMVHASSCWCRDDRVSCDCFRGVLFTAIGR